MTTTKEKKAEYDRQRRIDKKEYYVQKATAWNNANKDKKNAISRTHWIKKHYGLSIEDYEQKLKDQNYCCAICKQHQDNYQRRFAVDHCHTTGKVRDLLCVKCNQAFGLVNEDISILESMIEYAKRTTICSS